jgi:hypothetical protein
MTALQRRVKVATRPAPPPRLVLALALALLALILVALWLARGRLGGARSTAEAGERPHSPERFDTTLGEFHDMREALRPLEHTRAASRRVPQGQADARAAKR